MRCRENTYVSHTTLSREKDSTNRHQSLTITAVLGTLVCSILWGGQSVAVKIALVDFSPFLMMTGRTALACVFAFLWAKAAKHRLWLPLPELGLILANCLLLYTQIALFSVGTSMTESVRSIVLMCSFPVFTALVCLLVVPGTSLSLRHLTGLAAAILGIVVVFAEHFGGWNLSVWRGDLLVLAAAAVMGTQVVFFKSILKRLHPSQTVFWGSLLACPTYFSLSLLFETPVDGFPAVASLLAVAYQGIVVSGAAVMLWGYLLARHAANDLNVIRLSSPLFGMLAGWSILNEDLSSSLLLGALLIGLGIYLVIRVPEGAGRALLAWGNRMLPATEDLIAESRTANAPQHATDEYETPATESPKREK